MGNNGKVIFELQGTRKDFIGAWFMRLMQMIVGAGVLWMCKLIYGAVMYLVTTLPPMQVDVNSLKNDVRDLKEHAATKSELVEAEKRVKQEITEQLKNSPVITTTRGK
jgi:hypothetical protein